MYIFLIGCIVKKTCENKVVYFSNTTAFSFKKNKIVVYFTEEKKISNVKSIFEKKFKFHIITPRNIYTGWVSIFEKFKKVVIFWEWVIYLGKKVQVVLRTNVILQED